MMVDGVILTPVPSQKYDFSRYGVDIINARVWDHQNERWLVSNPNDNGYSYVGLMSAEGYRRSYGLHVVVMSSASAIDIELFGRGKIEIDHITPVVLGGGNDIGNLRMTDRKGQYRKSTLKRMSKPKPRFTDDEVKDILNDYQEWVDEDKKSSEFIHKLVKETGRGYRTLWNIVNKRCYKHLHNI